MSTWKATGRLVGRLAVVFIAPPIAYCALALALAVPWQGAGRPGEGDDAIRIFACDNGVHVDLVLPVAAAGWDWRSVFPAEHFGESSGLLDHVSIGWGSRDFYLATPEWRDLRLDFALKALLWDETVLHVEFRPRPLGHEACRQWLAPRDGYLALVRHVLRSIRAIDHRAEAVGQGYGSRDAFFLARGQYNPVQTCNQWSGRALALAGAPVGRWTPFSFLVAWRLPAVE